MGLIGERSAHDIQEDFTIPQLKFVNSFTNMLLYVTTVHVSKKSLFIQMWAWMDTRDWRVEWRKEPSDVGDCSIDQKKVLETKGGFKKNLRAPTLNRKTCNGNDITIKRLLKL